MYIVKQTIQLINFRLCEEKKSFYLRVWWKGCPCTIICMEKKYITSCLSETVLSLLHIWPLNYSC